MSEFQNIFTEAVSLHQQGRLAEAEQKYLLVLSALPDNGFVLANLGILCRDAGNLTRAREYCQRAVDLAPADVSAHLNLGAVFEALGDSAAAERCYEKVLALDQDHPKALNNLGKLLHLRGESNRGQLLVRKALAVEPRYPLALNNLGVMLSDWGELAEAADLLQRSLELDPGNSETIYNLAGLCNALDQPDRAAELLRRLLAGEPGHEPAEHMLAAITGRCTARAPSRYVQETFDRYAPRFDHHIQQKLGYDVPAALAALLNEILPEKSFTDGLDLGCGTGLSGRPFKGVCSRLTGIDLSEAMLAQAAAKQLYDRLECLAIEDFLKQDVGRYDLIIAADVLIYLGSLDTFFVDLARLTLPGAVIACSVEQCDPPDHYALWPSGRYAHGSAYLSRRAGAGGFTLLARRQHRIRKEQGSWIPGELFLLAKTD